MSNATLEGLVILQRISRVVKPLHDVPKSLTHKLCANQALHDVPNRLTHKLCANQAYALYVIKHPHARSAACDCLNKAAVGQ